MWGCTNIILLVAFISYRIGGSFLVKTAYVPDEYWQSLEVAHYLTFGYGHMTWEWKEAIRSCAYPGIYAAFYHVLQYFGKDTHFMLTHAPKIFQAALSGIGDYCTYKLSLLLHGKYAARWTAFSCLSSWFLFYCASRTLANSAEASVSSIGLYLFPWSFSKSRLKWAYLWLAGLSCMIRPTAAVQWLPLFLWHLFHAWSFRWKLLLRAFFVWCCTLSGLLIIDRWCFGYWVLTPYKFFHYNWTHDVGSIYGSHPFYWYFFIGFPVIMGTHLLPFLLGLRMHKISFLLCVIIWTLVVFSKLSHKEFRFLLPIMPLAMCICGVALSRIARFGQTFKAFHMSVSGIAFCFLMLIINIPLMIYTGLYHQRGTLEVVEFLAKQKSHNMDVLFLMPCHSTPYYSHIHRKIHMRFLTCEPNIEGIQDYVDEADVFFLNPMQWLSNNYGIAYGKAKKTRERTEIKKITENHKSIPSHIVFFDVLLPDIAPFLKSYHYKLCFSSFHTHFPNARIGQNVLVYCK